MSTSIAQNIEALCQEQGIDRELVVEAIKEAVRAAAKKQFKAAKTSRWIGAPKAAWNCQLRKSWSTTWRILRRKCLSRKPRTGGDEVEVGDALLLPMPMEELGRIAAQTAKQILFQKVRDAVRSNVTNNTSTASAN